MCEIEKGVLNNLFESREANLYVLTEMDKKQMLMQKEKDLNQVALDQAKNDNKPNDQKQDEV